VIGMAEQRERIPLEMEKPAHQAPDSVPSQPRPEASSPPPEQIDGPIDTQDVEEKIIAALKTCFDPEIPVNIYELGLIYDIDVEASGEVEIRMTLTSPACPAALTLPPEVQAKVSKVWGVKSANVEVVWDPPWTQERMSEAAKLQLGLF
jgi:FeS assembly SUF system protein